MWIDMYLGPPELIIYDAGPQFTAVEFSESARQVGTRTKCVPVEAYYSISMIERYYELLRRAYEIITKECLRLSKDHVLQMAMKAINDTAGLDAIVLTLLLFGSYPRLST